MNQRSRTQNSAINIVITLICQILNLVLSFIVRTYFIKLLGADYLGVSGLFGNILSILSMADLGIGAAITFALYKPIEEKQIDKIQAYMNFFKKAYRIIAAIVFSLGCLCIPFLGYLVNLPEEIPNLVYIYILQLLCTTASYLCIYKSTMLVADQRSFVTKLINTFGIILANVLELIILVLTHNYIGYLVMQLLSTVIVNLCTSIVADKMYPFLHRNKQKLSSEEQKKLFVGIKAIIIYRIAGVILNATDNILISVLISTTVVGYYSNYTLICGAVTGVASLIFEALKGSIGSLNATGNVENAKRNFKSLTLFNFWIYGFISICLFVLLNDFIEIWIGTKYVFPMITVLAIVLNVYIPGSMMVVANYRDTTGLYIQTKFIQVFAVIINLILSVILGKWIGVSGIIIATSIARLLTSVWFEPHILYKEYFRENVIKFYLMQCKNLVFIIITYIITYAITMRFPTGTLIWFAVKTLTCVIIVNILFVIFFCRTSEFKDLLNKVKFLFK